MSEKEKGKRNEKEEKLSFPLFYASKFCFVLT